MKFDRKNIALGGKLSIESLEMENMKSSLATAEISLTFARRWSRRLLCRRENRGDLLLTKSRIERK